MRFGPVDDYEQLLRAFFLCFQGQKKYLFKKIYFSIRTKKFHNISFIIFLFLNFFWISFWLEIGLLNIDNKLCIPLLETPPYATSIKLFWYFTANKTHCRCQRIRPVFSLLEIYNFARNWSWPRLAPRLRPPSKK